MTTKEKKEAILLAVLLLAIGGVVYYNFFRTPSSSNVVPVTLTATPGVPGAAGPGATSGAPVNASGKLNLDTSILTDPRVTQLSPPIYPTVTRQELGTNPFK